MEGDDTLAAFVAASGDAMDNDTAINVSIRGIG
jgi:hypothetical protein